MKRIVLFSRKHRRANKLCNLARSAFWAAISSCETVSYFNHDLAFIIRRKNAFGFPTIEKTPRPDVVCLAEDKNCVIVKDGFYYELSKQK